MDPISRLVPHLFPGARLRASERLPGGVSADVHRLDIELADGRSRRVVLRAHGAGHAGHDAEVEYRLLGALRARSVPVPEPLFVDASRALLAHPYLVMAFVDGSSAIPAAGEAASLDAMAQLLVRIHALPLDGLPALPSRIDPLPEVFDYLPTGSQWADLHAHLRSLADTAYAGTPRVLHGDFWPENVLWKDGRIVAILDWEDAALGDPLSDVACTRVELRYRFGRAGMRRFTDAYARHRPVDRQRLALWQVYVAAAAQHFMGGWGLEAGREAHMRREALASLGEAAAALIDGTDP